MNVRSLISHSRKHYVRYYRLVALAVILLMAVLTGSLLLGDSVRGTLTRRVTERLGQTETLVTSGTGFMSQDILVQPIFRQAKGCLLVDGYVSVGEKLLPVYVWGVDDDSLSYGDVLVNEPLMKKLGGEQDFVLHLPSHNLVPSGTLFVTQSYATQMRLHVVGRKSVADGGNILLKNEQTLPLNVFVSRRQLAETMELEGKINIILSDDIIREDQLAACWNPEYSGLHITDSSLTYDGIFLPQQVVDRMGDCSRYFSYLVNDMICGTDTVPYSFVTAVDQWMGEPLVGNDIILSDYAAQHLHLTEGDSIRMSYFLAKDLKNLDTREQRFRVKAIVPLAQFLQDSLLIAEFPGLSNVERCTDWDSDLPIKMDRVHKVDEDFWYQYHQTPKALVAYDAVQGDWSNAYGSATALRFEGPRQLGLRQVLGIGYGVDEKYPRVANTLAQRIIPSDLGILLIHPRAEGLKAAAEGVDFGGLFLALGAFIIFSAILLMASPLQEMFVARSDEARLYLQMGFPRRKVVRIFFREAYGVMLLASPVGVLLGVHYSWTTLWLLGNVWSGATHTEGFRLYVQPTTLLLGWLVGLLLCALTLWLVVRKVLRTSAKSPQSGSHAGRRWLLFAVMLTVTVALITLNFLRLHSMMLFILCGLLWVVTFGLFLRAWVLHKVSVDTRTPVSMFTRSQVTWHSIHYSLRQHLLAYWTLALGVFTVFAVGLNRPDFSHADQATGGYQLYVDCRVPIQYDLNNETVRQKLSLDALPDSTHFLQFLRHTQDDASCLNLNRVSTPTVLGVDLNAMRSFGLTPSPNTQYPIPAEGPSPSTLNPIPSRSEYTQYPCAANIYLDQESLLWSLMKSVGDTVHYQNERGEQVPVLIAGTYPTGIFHGNAIMSTEDFRRLWPRESGVEVLLVQSSRPDEAAEMLSIALSEYGLTIQTVDERLAMFFEVTETYLVIFLTLGGLGLLLGVFSLVVIVRKNLTAQLPFIRQYDAMGFPPQLVHRLLLHQNLLVPFFAILTGVVGSFISISANVGGAGIHTFLQAFAFLLALCLLVYLGIRHIIHKTVKPKSEATEKTDKVELAKLI